MNANGDCLHTQKPNHTCGKHYTLFVVGDGFSTSNCVVRGSKKHVHSKERSTGHLYECICASTNV